MGDFTDALRAQAALRKAKGKAPAGPKKRPAPKPKSVHGEDAEAIGGEIMASMRRPFK